MPDPTPTATPFALARHCLEDLPRGQRRLARALLEQPQAFAFGSIQELASRFDADLTTILRFAQALGYTGHRALQAAVRRAYLDQAGQPPPARRPAAAGAVERAESVRARHLANLAQAHRRLRVADLERAAGLLAEARTVLVAADGAAETLAGLFAGLLRRVAVRAERLPAERLDRAVRLAGVGGGDAVVGIGLRLPFRDVADALAAARRQGAATLAIAGASDGPLARQAALTLDAPALGAGLPCSVVATVAVMELVATEIAGRRPERVEEIDRLLHSRCAAEDLLSAPAGEGTPPVTNGRPPASRR